MFIINHLAKPCNSDCSVYDDICKWREILGIEDEEYIKKRENAYAIARYRFYILLGIISFVRLYK